MPGARPSLVIDNYDSFTWNLVQLLRELGDDPLVLRNDDPRLHDDLDPVRVLISPGPGRPEQAGSSIEWIRRSIGVRPLLGVCLGHQALGQVFGLRLDRAPVPVHGKTAVVDHDERDLFAGVRKPLRVMRYHSLLLTEPPPGSPLRLSATTTEAGRNLVMALQHREYPVAGLQFHPESFLTEDGHRILENFLSW